MDDLEIHINKLKTFILKYDASLSWSRVLIIEDEKMIHGNPSLIPRSALVTPEDYAMRFDEHLGKGYSWINMNAAGILGDTLLVVIELPNYVSGSSRDKVSINFSGAAMLRGKPVWDASERFEIVG